MANTITFSIGLNGDKVRHAFSERHVAELGARASRASAQGERGWRDWEEFLCRVLRTFERGRKKDRLSSTEAESGVQRFSKRPSIANRAILRRENVNERVRAVCSGDILISDARKLGSFRSARRFAPCGGGSYSFNLAVPNDRSRRGTRRERAVERHRARTFFFFYRI